MARISCVADGDCLCQVSSGPWHGLERFRLGKRSEEAPHVNLRQTGMPCSIDDTPLYIGCLQATKPIRPCVISDRQRSRTGKTLKRELHLHWQDRTILTQVTS